MKLIKKLAFILLFLIVMTVTGLWVLSKTLSPDTVKTYINYKLTELTHKPSQINGDIAWQVLPRPGVKVTKISVGDRNQTKDYTLSIEQLKLNLNITPLLRGQLVFGDIQIDGLNLTANLDEPGKSSADTAKPNPSKQAGESKGNTFAIDRLMLTRSQINLQKKGQALKLHDIQLGIEQLNTSQQPFPVQLKAIAVADAGKNHLQLNLHFNGRLGLSQLNKQSELLNKSTLNGQLLLEKIMINALKINKISANLKKEAQTLKLNPMSISLHGGESIGDMSYQLNKNELDFNQTATSINSQNLLTQLLGYELIKGGLDYSIHGAIAFDKPSLEHLSLKGSITMKDGALIGINIEKLVRDTADKLDFLIPGKTPDLKQALALSQFNLKSYSQGNTPFSLASLQFHLRNARFVIDTLLLQNKSLKVKGEGELNLLNDAVNTRLEATVLSDTQDSQLMKIQSLLGGSFPVTITGELERPIVLPDVKIINSLVSQYLIKQVLDKPVKDVQNQLKSLFH